MTPKPTNQSVEERKEPFIPNLRISFETIYVDGVYYIPIPKKYKLAKTEDGSIILVDNND